MRPPRIVIAAAGSLGDLHPFIALGLALQARGFQAEIASSAEYRARIEAAGLAFHAIGPSLAEMEADLGMTLSEITQAIIDSDVFIFQRVVLPYLETGVRQMIAVSDGARAIMGSTLTVGAGLTAERLDLPFVSVLLQPTLAFSAYDPPYLPKAPWLAPADGGFGLWRNRTTIALARLIAAGMTRPLNRVRARLGLAATRANIVFDAAAGADLALGLYSPLLGTVQPDSPPGFLVTGYAPMTARPAAPPSCRPRWRPSSPQGLHPLSSPWAARR